MQISALPAPSVSPEPVSPGQRSGNVYGKKLVQQFLVRVFDFKFFQGNLSIQELVDLLVEGHLQWFAECSAFRDPRAQATQIREITIDRSNLVQDLLQFN